MHINELKRKYVDWKWCHINNRFVKRGGSAGCFAVISCSVGVVVVVFSSRRGEIGRDNLRSLSGLECANMR